LYRLTGDMDKTHHHRKESESSTSGSMLGETSVQNAPGH